MATFLESERRTGLSLCRTINWQHVFALLQGSETSLMKTSLFVVTVESSEKLRERARGNRILFAFLGDNLITRECGALLLLKFFRLAAV